MTTSKFRKFAWKVAQVTPALLLLLGLSLWSSRSCCADPPLHDKGPPDFSVNPTPGQQVPQRLTHEKDADLWIDYLVFLPKDYDATSDKQWPVILFLHGAGKRGSDVRVVAGNGPPMLAAKAPAFPYIVISPQCPAGTWWEFRLQQLDLLLDQLPKMFAIDEDRIYLTGLSAGGFGSWRLAAHRPHTFAAVAPICGGLNPPDSHDQLAPKLKNIPIWAFHGDADKVVPLWKGKKIAEAVNKLGGQVRLTIYAGVGHDAWTQTYNNKDLYRWFDKHTLAHRKQEP